jgi:ribosomal protein S18 acetylase RimI-like enzyme
VFRPAATLMQLAVAPSHRRKGIGTAIMVMLQNEVAEPLQVNNIDEELKGTCGFYEALGFKVLLRQFEMVKTL